MVSEYFSYQELEEFIGRETILNDIRGWLQDGKFHLAFFSGEYGIGKTRLLKRILELARKETKYEGAPTHLIDLYHFRHHSPEGLANAIFRSFENTDNEHYFHPFITARRKLDEARAGGDSGAIHQRLGEVLKSCIEGIKAMSAKDGVLLLFDTAEQFVYPTGARFAPAWDWLKGWIGELQRGAVLFAGRPEASPLFQQIQTISLGLFSLKESAEYLSAVAKNWLEKKGQSVIFAEDDVEKLHTLSQGRPILLAIFLESRMYNPQAFKDLSEYQTQNFEQKVIEYLRSQPELGETLAAAGRARKGVNVDLLAKMRGIPIHKAKEALETLGTMSFAKIFPDDDRVYLHDDMYDLLEKYVYLGESDSAERQAAAQTIYEYYESVIKQKTEELQGIYASLTRKDSEQSILSSEENIDRIRRVEEIRQRLKAEFIYYRLRNQVKKEGERKWFEDDPILAGLKMHYRYSHEAATSNNDEILIALQIELTNFWLALADENLWKLIEWLRPEDRNSWEPFIAGLLLIHEVWIKEATGQPYGEDIPTLEKSLNEIANLSKDQRAILHALLETWRAIGLAFGKPADHKNAEKIFGEVIRATKSLAVEERLTWFRNVVLSLAYRQRAYLHRIRGLFEDAIKDFGQSLNYSRSIHFNHEEATLRNDLGFAQMQNGDLLPALENMQDGLRLRYALAVGPRTALSLSSLAQYYIATGAYEDARKYAQYAVRIANAVGFRRGIGFGNLALAEATRRFAFSAEAPPNRADVLREAQDAIEIALENIHEPARIIDAKLEQACLYRDRIRVETDPAKKKAWFEKSDQQLQQVAHEAEREGIAHRQVDAMSNRIWLGNFAEDMDHAEQAAKEFEQLPVLKPYWFENGKFVDEGTARENPQLWAQVGKYYIGRGIVALTRWKIEKDENSFNQSAHWMMLGLQYDIAFANDHRGIREGRLTVLRELAKLNSDELKRFSGYVLDAEKSEKIVKEKEQSVLQKLMRGHILWFAD